MRELDPLYSDKRLVNLLQPRPFVEGVIAAASCSPEIPMPPQWMPWTFIESASQSQPEALNHHDWERITDCLIKTLRDTLALMKAGKTLIPKSYASPKAFNSHSDQAVWLTGFLFAHQQLQPVWQAAWEYLEKSSQTQAETAASTLKHCLKMFSVLADPDAVTHNDDVREQLPHIAKTLPRALSQYVALANELAGFLPNQFESFTETL